MYRGCSRYLIFGQDGVIFGAFKVQEFRSGATSERAAVISLLDSNKCSQPRWVERATMAIGVQELGVYYLVDQGYACLTWLAETPQKGRDFILPFKLQMGEFVWKVRQAAVLLFYRVAIRSKVAAKAMEAALLDASSTAALDSIVGKQLPSQVHFDDPTAAQGARRERKPTHKNLAELRKTQAEQAAREEREKAVAAAEKMDLIPAVVTLGSLFPLPEYTATLYLERSLGEAAKALQRGSLINHILKGATGNVKTEDLFQRALEEARTDLRAHLLNKDTRIFTLRPRADKGGKRRQPRATPVTLQHMLSEEQAEDRDDPCLITHPELFSEPANLRRLLEVRLSSCATA